MKLDFTSEVPLYLQIGSALKEEILGGVYGEEEQVPSTTEISLTYKINPATVLKGYNLLVDEDIIYPHIPTYEDALVKGIKNRF